MKLWRYYLNTEILFSTLTTVIRAPNKMFSIQIKTAFTNPLYCFQVVCSIVVWHVLLDSLLTFVVVCDQLHCDAVCQKLVFQLECVAATLFRDTQIVTALEIFIAEKKKRLQL